MRQIVAPLYLLLLTDEVWEAGELQTVVKISCKTYTALSNFCIDPIQFFCLQISRGGKNYLTKQIQNELLVPMVNNQPHIVSRTFITMSQKSTGINVA